MTLLNAHARNVVAAGGSETRRWLAKWPRPQSATHWNKVQWFQPSLAAYITRGVSSLSAAEALQYGLLYPRTFLLLFALHIELMGSAYKVFNYP